MAGQLLERIAVLMKSDLADFFEINGEGHDPSTEAINQMLAELRAALGERLALAHKKSKALSALSDELVEYVSKAEFAVASGRDDLARSALVRKLELTQKADALREELAFVDSETEQLEAAINRLMTERVQTTGHVESKSVPDQATQLAELDALFAAKDKNRG